MATKKILGPQLLGPLTPLVGEWEGNVGVDVSYRYNNDQEIVETSYFEIARFEPAGITNNGDQSLPALRYQSTAWRHGEEALAPFHDEVGYLIWDEKMRHVIRSVAFGRGITIQAGAEAGPRDRELHFKATPGDPAYGILQNPYLMERAELKSFDSTFKFNDDGTFTHSSEIILKLAILGGEEMNHTDINTMHRVKRYHPGSEYR